MAASRCTVAQPRTKRLLSFTTCLSSDPQTVSKPLGEDLGDSLQQKAIAVCRWPCVGNCEHMQCSAAQQRFVFTKNLLAEAEQQQSVKLS